MELLNILSIFGLIMLFFFGLLLVGFRKLSHNEWKELKEKRKLREINVVSEPATWD